MFPVAFAFPVRIVCFVEKPLKRIYPNEKSTLEIDIHGMERNCSRTFLFVSAIHAQENKYFAYDACTVRSIIRSRIESCFLRDII